MTISALIMAGGQGLRMGGKDKGLVLWKGKAFVDYVVEALYPQVDNIAISINRNFEEYAERTPNVFTDARQWQGLGPLAALATAACNIQLNMAEWLLIVPCDTLLLPDDLVATFIAAAENDPSVHAFYAETATQPHYSVMFIRPRLLQSTPAYLSTGMRTLQGWLEQQHAQAVRFDNEQSFMNFNSEQEIDKPIC